MKRWDPIWYRQTIRGGYGFAQDVPGVFVKQTARRTTVRLHLKSGLTTDVVVSPKNVRPRNPDAVFRQTLEAVRDENCAVDPAATNRAERQWSSPRSAPAVDPAGAIRGRKGSTRDA